MVVCFMVEFSVSIEQAVDEEAEANPAKGEEADSLDRHCSAHAITNDSTTPKTR
jgi:hypothetical protein